MLTLVPLKILSTITGYHQHFQSPIFKAKNDATLLPFKQPSSSLDQEKLGTHLHYRPRAECLSLSIWSCQQKEPNTVSTITFAMELSKKEFHCVHLLVQTEYRQAVQEELMLQMLMQELQKWQEFSENLEILNYVLEILYTLQH